MDFEPTDEQSALREATRALLTARAPVTATRSLLDTDNDFDTELWRLGAEMGWPALAVSEKDGGLGQQLIDLTLVAVEHGRHVLPSPLLPTVVVSDAIARIADTQVKQRHLPCLLDGTSTAAWAFAEFGKPWTIEDCSTLAVEDPDGFILDGAKANVQDAASAAVLLVDVLYQGEPARFLVPADAPGVSIRRQRTLDLTRALDDVMLENVRVPREALLADATRARAEIARSQQMATVLTCADLVGVGERLLELTVEYVKERRQFDQPVGSFQAIKHKCANMRMWVQAATAATYYAAMAVDAGSADAERAVSVAKSYASDAIGRTAGEALQSHGGIGFTWEHDLHLFIRRARSDALLCGDVTHHREVLCRGLERAKA
ncbi:acyl-CoA dehydrogenase family protein [Nocardia arizonensis]|uniref:acyl-CoA dehydrogenase family protein n=1 Tax=Nocardia arizonensis TaxID=1141647 RepID=UPI0006D01043|nr:acyl-CoA dehydrogenase family protein [Nocardia arizonensis]